MVAPTVLVIEKNDRGTGCIHGFEGAKLKA
jgi:hypothetical protein